MEERKEKEKVVRWSGRRCEKEGKVVREDKQEIEMGERKKKTEE